MATKVQVPAYLRQAVTGAAERALGAMSGRGREVDAAEHEAAEHAERGVDAVESSEAKLRVAAEVDAAMERELTSALRFIWMTDPHHVSGGNQLGAAAAVCEAVRLSGAAFILLGGDFSVNGLKQEVREAQREIVQALRASGVPVLPVKGNHDDNSIRDFYHAPHSVDEVIFPQEMYEDLFRPLEGTVSFDAENPHGMYYYYDVPEQRARVIVLDAIDIPYRTRPEGGLQYNGQWKYAFSQRQLNWFAHEALRLPGKFGESAGGGEAGNGAGARAKVGVGVGDVAAGADKDAVGKEDASGMTGADGEAGVSAVIGADGEVNEGAQTGASGEAGAGADKDAGAPWSILICSHIPILQDGLRGTDHPIENAEVLWGILQAWREGGAYRSSVADGDFAYEVEADFSGSYAGGGRGEAAVCLAGHVHVDQQLLRDGVWLVTSDCAHTSREFDDQPERIAGTASETAFDIVTVDAAAGRMHFARVGAGADREIVWRSRSRG